MFLHFFFEHHRSYFYRTCLCKFCLQFGTYRIAQDVNQLFIAILKCFFLIFEMQCLNLENFILGNLVIRKASFSDERNECQIRTLWKQI